MTALGIALGAVFAQVLLVAIVCLRLLVLRLAQVRAREVRLREVALGDDAWSEAGQKAQNNLRNQFELPVLFFACVTLAAATDSANAGLALFAVLFVAARYVHAWIHLGSNYVPRRFFAFAAGALALAGCWVALGLALLRLV